MSGLLDNIVTGASQTVSDVSFGLYTPAVTQGSSTTDPSSISTGETLWRNSMEFLKSDLYDYGEAAFDIGKDFLKKGGKGGVAGIFAFAGEQIGGYLGNMAGDALGNGIISLFNMDKVETNGNAPVCVGDNIAHARKDLANIGAILGAAVVLVAVGAVTVATRVCRNVWGNVRDRVCFWVYWWFNWRIF